MKDRLDNSTNRIGYISERRVLGDVNGAANGEGWCRRPGGLGNEGSSSIVAECIRAYTAKFGDRLFVLDAFVVYLLSCALLLTSYAVATGAFEFGRTALFAAIGSCVGTATLSVCLRTQVLNFKEFKVTECRAVQDFLLCFVVLQVAVFLLID